MTPFCRSALAPLNFVAYPLGPLFIDIPCHPLVHSDFLLSHGMSLYRETLLSATDSSKGTILPTSRPTPPAAACFAVAFDAYDRTRCEHPAEE
jgi:hypothetical protein